MAYVIINYEEVISRIKKGETKAHIRTESYSSIPYTTFISKIAK